MRRSIALMSCSLLLLASLCCGQSVEVVELTATTQTVERTTLSFNGLELEAGETTGKTVSVKQQAILLTTDGPANVSAFNKDFELANVAEVEAGKYLITGKPGKYLAVVDTDKGNSFIPVIIPGKEAPPEQPPQAPGGDLSSLEVLSAKRADSVNDPQTRAKLAVELAKPLPSDYQRATGEVTRRVEEVLLFRDGESRNADWLAGWRLPMVEAMIALEVDTIEEYKEAVAYIAKGLAKAAVQESEVAKRSVRPKRYKQVVRQVCGPFGCREVVEWVLVQ